MKPSEIKLLGSLLFNLHDRKEIISQLTSDTFVTSQGKKMFSLLVKYPDLTTEDLDVIAREADLDLSEIAMMIDKATSSLSSMNIALEELKLESFLKRKAQLETKLKNVNDYAKQLEAYSNLIKNEERLLKTDNGTLLEAQEAYSNYIADNDALKFMNVPTLNDLTCGFKKNEIWVVGARTGTGKSFFVLDFAMQQVLNNKKVLFYSLELDKYANYNRLAYLFKSYNNCDFNVAIAGLAEVTNLKLFTSLRNWESISNSILNEVEKSKVDLVVLDHLQSLEYTEKGKEYDQISNLMKSIQRFVLKTNTRMMLVSQLNRGTANNNVPISNFGYAGSGAIEHNCDKAILLSRNIDEKTQVMGNEVVINLQKNRQGSTGMIHAYINFPGGVFHEIQNS